MASLPMNAGGGGSIEHSVVVSGHVHSSSVTFTIPSTEIEREVYFIAAVSNTQTVVSITINTTATLTQIARLDGQSYSNNYYTIYIYKMTITPNLSIKITCGGSASYKDICYAILN